MEKLTPLEWRKAKSKTVVDCAEALNVSPMTWRKWEQQPSLIPMGKAEEFCQFLGISAELVCFLP